MRSSIPSIVKLLPLGEYSLAQDLVAKLANDEAYQTELRVGIQELAQGLVKGDILGNWSDRTRTNEEWKAVISALWNALWLNNRLPALPDANAYWVYF